MSNPKRPRTINDFFGGKQPVDKEKTPKGRKKCQDEYEERRQRKFNESWITQFPGIRYDEEKDAMFCLHCETFRTMADPKSSFVSGGSTSFRIDTIRTHWASKGHLKCDSAYRLHKEGVMEKGPMDDVMQRLGEENREVLVKLFNTVYFILQEEMPFTSLPRLIKLQQKNGSALDRLISYCSDQACRRIAIHIAEQLREEMMEGVRNAKFLSLCYDGATDVSVAELEVIYIRYLNTHGTPVSNFMKIVDVEHAHADGVYSAIDRAFTDIGLPEWKDKVIGAGSDGASVNIGVKNSVSTLIRAEHPYILTIHCVAHRLEIGVLRALKENKHLKDVQDVLQKIHKHYHYSPKALRELRLIAESLEEKVLKPTRLSGTRWMPHISKALKTLLTSYSVLVAHFEHVGEARQATAEVQGRATFLYKALKNAKTLRFMHHMLDILEVVSVLSLTFQKDEITAGKVLDAVETANLQLIELAAHPGEHLNNFQAAVDQETSRYKDVQLTQFQPLEDHRELGDVAELVRRHINDMVEGTGRRGEGRQQRDILRACRVFEVSEWPRRREELAEYGNQKVETLVDHFRPVLERSGCQLKSVGREWLALKAHISGRVDPHLPLPDIKQIFRLESEARLPYLNILMVLEVALVLPMCTANCERGFSAMKRIKADWRASLTTEMLDLLMLVALEGEPLETYDCTRSLDRWWRRGQRARRPLFRDQPGPSAALGAAPEPPAEEDELLDFFLK